MVADIPLQNLVVFWVGAFLGAFAAGGTGFAFALAVSAGWLHVLDPLHTTAMVVASGTLLHGILIWPIRRSIEMARLWRFIAGAAIRHSAGRRAAVAYACRHHSHRDRRLPGGYGLYALTAPQLPYFGRGGRAADALVGFAGGILGGLGGYSGVLPHLDADTRLAERGGARRVPAVHRLRPGGTLLLIGAITVDRAGILLFASTLPALALGAWLGLRVYGHLKDWRFRQVLSVLLLLSGLTLFA
jgi:uncharacterized protein